MQRLFVWLNEPKIGGDDDEDDKHDEDHDVLKQPSKKPRKAANPTSAFAVPAKHTSEFSQADHEYSTHVLQNPLSQPIQPIAKNRTKTPPLEKISNTSTTETLHTNQQAAHKAMISKLLANNTGLTVKRIVPKPSNRIAAQNTVASVQIKSIPVDQKPYISTFGKRVLKTIVGRADSPQNAPRRAGCM